MVVTKASQLPWANLRDPSKEEEGSSIRARVTDNERYGGEKENKEEKELKCKEIGDFLACIYHNQKINACANIVFSLLTLS